jgi:1,4-alpha-glucan branching enzyme
VICNFSGAPVYDYTVELPETGRWEEILNSDAREHGGSGVGNLGVVETDEHGRATMVLPPLGVLWLSTPPRDRV